MRKLILEEWISLDGFVSDKKGGLDFFTQLPPADNKASEQDQLQFLQTLDAILLGRKTYELFPTFWPTATTNEAIVADRLNEIPKIVFSNTLAHAPWGTWSEARIENGDAVAAVRRLKSLPGKNMVMWGSISLAQALMKEQLVDEYRVQLCPVLLEEGRRLFTGDLHPCSLRLVKAKQYPTGIVLLHYAAAARG